MEKHIYFGEGGDKMGNGGGEGAPPGKGVAGLC